MTNQMYDGYIFEGSASDLVSELERIKPVILKLETPEHLRKLGLELSSYLDSNFRTSVKLSLLDQWLTEMVEDQTFIEMKSIKVWFNCLNKSRCLVKFFNLSNKNKLLLEQNLKLKEYGYSSASRPKEISSYAWEARKNVWTKFNPTLPWADTGFMFTIYRPSLISLDLIFKHMPPLAKRQRSLAEKTVGNNWISLLPANQVPMNLFEAISYLKTEDGKAKVELEIKGLRKQKFINKINQIIAG